MELFTNKIRLTNMPDKPKTHRITVINIPEDVYQKIITLKKQERSKSASAIALMLMEDGLTFTEPTENEVESALKVLENKLLGDKYSKGEF